MIDSKYNWIVAEQNNDSETIHQIAEELNLSPVIVNILFNRGYQNKNDIQQFLNPDPNNLADPFLIHDMQKGIERITAAIENDEQITVYGDYDADGLTSTAIMYETLTELGAKVNFYIPNRFIDGYGPNPKAFKKIIDDGTSLIITVDNGVTGFDAVDFANQNDCDVIITDHHEIPTKGTPDAYAVIHARFPGSEYSFGYFSGAGIAFKVASALLDEVPQECLDLVTIGTIADLVSLTGENRILAKFGFQAIQKTQRPGLQMLLKHAKLTDRSINEHSIGFGIAPRLNALGRMGDANVGVELLTTLDDSRAQQLADLTESLNNERRKLVADIFKAACEQADQPKQQNKKTLVVMGNDWHEGVVGIVASRLVDKYHKPTVVLDLNQDTGIAKGSGRSINGFNIFAALEPGRDQMIKFGGHDMAIGLTIKATQVQKIAKIFENNFKQPMVVTDTRPKLTVDSLINVDIINDHFYDGLAKMAPFGTDNSQPLFEIQPDSISNVQTMGNKNNHLRFRLVSEHNQLNAVAFNRVDALETLQNMGNAMRLVGKIEMNSWNNQNNLQFITEDIQSTGIEIIDRRTKRLNSQMFEHEGTYLFFNKSLMNKITPYINEKSNIIWYNDLSTEKVSDVVTIVDCPDRFADLKKVADFISDCTIILYLFKPSFVYVNGLPTRAQFGQLFKLLSRQNQVMINQEINHLARQMSVSRNLIIFMVKVFQDLNLVLISNGTLEMTVNPQKQDLLSSSAYQKRRLQLQSEQQLLLPNSATLVTLFNNLIG